MQKLHRRTVWFFRMMAAIAILSGLSLPVWGADKNEVEKLIEQTRKQLTGMIKKEHNAMSSLVTSQKQLDQVEGKIGKIDNELQRAHTRLESLASQISQIQLKLKELETQRNQRRDQMNNRLVALYKYGLGSHLEVLAQANNFSDFVNRFELVSRFVRKDLTVLDSIGEKCREVNAEEEFLSNRKDDLQLEKKRIDQLKVQHVAAKEMLEDTVDKKQDELAKIQTNRKELEKALDELERTSKEMEERIRNYQDRNGPAIGSGHLQWPVVARITSGFGWRFHPILRTRKFHTGYDLGVPSGTPIRACDNGFVMYSGWNGGYGKMVSIDHGNHISTVYAHCSSLQVNVGDRVVQGQVIALSGSTGLSTGPHLHFEVRLDGTPVDPGPYLP